MPRLLLTLCLLLAGFAPAAGQPAGLLARRVRVPAVTGVPLQQVLRELSRRSGVPFSYSSTLIPVRAKVSLRPAPDQPLGAVLTGLFRGQRVSYAVVDNQVVLWRTGERPPPAAPPATATAATATTTRQTAGAAATSGAAAGQPTNPSGQVRRSTARAVPAVTFRSAPMTTAGAAGAGAEAARAARVASVRTGAAPVGRSGGGRGKQTGQVGKAGQVGQAGQQRPPDSGNRPLPGRAAPDSLAADAARAARLTATARRLAATRQRLTRFSASFNGLVDRLAARVVLVATDSVAARDTALALLPRPLVPPAARSGHRRWQVSLVPPLGTNGRAGAGLVNDYSFNLLVGRAAGVGRLEVGGLVNLVCDSVRGVQAAGLLNLSGRHAAGVQAAGLLNVLRGPGTGVQAAGLLNVTLGSFAGVQTAGLLNVTRGAGAGVQAAGLFNFSGLPAFPPAASPAALSAAITAGPPAAPATTTATGAVRLVQVAGLFNVARHDVAGAQVAGLFNVAGRVQGSQVGLVNFADSVSGVSMGLLNFVRRGYHHLELSGSEGWPVQGSLKLGGSPRFYTFLTGAADPLRPFRWALGYGAGTEMPLGPRFGLNLDLLTQHVDEEAGWLSSLNLHNQLRVLGSWTVRRGGRTRFFAGPVANVLVSQLYDADTRRVGSRLGAGQLLAVERTSGPTLVRGWLGGSAGVRF